MQAFGTATGLVTARAIVGDLYPADRMARMLASADHGRGARQFARARAGWLRRRGTGLARDLRVLMLATLAWAASSSGAGCPRRARPSRPPRGREMAGTALVAGARCRMFAGCVLQSAVVYATFLVFISLAPYVMVSALGRPTTEFGFYYLFIAAGLFLRQLVGGQVHGAARPALDGGRRRAADGRRRRLGTWLRGAGPDAPAVDLRADRPAVLRAGLALPMSPRRP